MLCCATRKMVDVLTRHKALLLQHNKTITESMLGWSFVQQTERNKKGEQKLRMQ